MFTLIIPIQEATLDVITDLNGGVTPAIETEDTVFVYRGEDAHASIMSVVDYAKEFTDTGLRTCLITTQK